MTLLEALIGTSLFLVVLFGVYAAYEPCQALFGRANAQAQIQGSARMAIERMSRDLRMAGADPSGTGQPAVQRATSARLAVITDVDGNNVSDLVTYSLDAPSGTLRRAVQAWTGTGWGPAAESILARDVVDLRLQYLPTAAVPGLKRIAIRLQTARPVPFQPPQQFEVTTEVFLRNL